MKIVMNLHMCFPFRFWELADIGLYLNMIQKQEE